MRDQPDLPPSGEATNERLTRAARSAQQLCDVLWETLHEELRQPGTARVVELSARLAEISSTVGMLATAPRAAASGPATVERRTPPEPSLQEAPRSESRPTAELRLAPHPPGVSEPSVGADAPGQAAPSPFERSPADDRPARSERSSNLRHASEPEEPEAAQSIATRAVDYTFTKLVDEHEAHAAESPPTEIEIRDVRREEGASAWVSSVGRLLSRHAEDGLPFAVLLVEIVDVAHLERSATPHDLHGLVAKIEAAIGRAMRSGDHLSRETLGRYWLVAPETNGTGARMLAERLARLVRTSASHRGVPMEVAIGIAICPDDGTEAPALAARADLGVYSARATGRSIAHTDPPSAS